MSKLRGVMWGLVVAGVYVGALFLGMSVGARIGAFVLHERPMAGFIVGAMCGALIVFWLDFLIIRLFTDFDYSYAGFYIILPPHHESGYSIFVVMCSFVGLVFPFLLALHYLADAVAFTWVAYRIGGGRRI